MCMSWNKQMSIGNTIVDSEHKHLISLANYVERAMRIAMETHDCGALRQTFEQLELELRRHFHNEEKIAGAIGIPFEAHLKAQEHMLCDLRFLKVELMAKDCFWTEAALEHFSTFLESLLNEHITQVDRPLKSALQNYDYDFWPKQTGPQGVIAIESTAFGAHPPLPLSSA